MIDDFEYMSDSESEGLCLENLPSSRSMGDLSSVEIDYLNEVKDNKGAYESRLEELGINNIENVSHSSDFIENYDDVLLARAKVNTLIRTIWTAAIVIFLICVLSIFIIVRIKRRKAAKQRGLDELSRLYEGEDE